MTGIWHVMSKEPIIGVFCMHNGLQESHLLVYHSIPYIYRRMFNLNIIHILHICSVPDVERSNMQLR